MSDIITADNLPLVIGAVLSGLAGLAVWRSGGKLGDGAKDQKPPQIDVTVAGGLIMSSTGSQAMIDALEDIAAAVREATEFARENKASKTDSILKQINEAVGRIEDSHPPPKQGPRRG